MQNRLRSLLCKLAPLTEENLASLEKIIKTVPFEKGMCFAVDGAAVDTIGFLLGGVLKYSTVNSDGQEFIVYFAGPGDFVADFSALVNGDVASLRIEATSPGIMAQIRWSDLNSLQTQDQVWLHLRLKICEKTLVRAERRIKQLLTLDAKGRYVQFLQDYRGILGKISQRDIALFLGIAPTSFSRLTAGIIQEKRK